MKCTAILVSALAAVATAAPTSQLTERNSFDASSLNGLKFNSANLEYLNVINSLNLNALQQLSVNNNFNVVAFQSLFNQQSFNVQTLLELQQLQTLLQFQQLGVLNQFDLSTLQLNSVNLGLINNIGSQDLTQFIDVSLTPQIQSIIQQGSVTVVSA